MQPYALQARYVFPIDTPPLADGVLSISGPQVAGVSHRSGDVPTFELGNAAILPAFVNAHTHLEFSHLRTPLGRHGMPFTDWIRTVIAHRTQRERFVSERSVSIDEGLEESLGWGVAALGEIATPGWKREPLLGTSAAGTIFLELIGLSTSRIEEMTDRAERHIDAGGHRIAHWQTGLSPHAPYTAHRELVADAARLSAAHAIPLAMHVAESREELQLLRDGNGPLRDLLMERDVWQPAAIPPGSRPLDYLEILATAHRSLVVHGNYLDDEEIRTLNMNRIL